MIRFVTVSNFVLMKVGKTANNFEITKDMINDTLSKYGFDCAPIVLNANQYCKDYRDETIIADYFKDKCIGSVIPGTVRFDGIEVKADVLLLKEYENRTHYDNWYCNFDENQMDYLSCELFTVYELEKEVN